MSTSPAKFAVGDLVDLSVPTGGISIIGTRVVDREYLINKKLCSKVNGGIFIITGWHYKVDADNGRAWAVERILSPHNPPTDITTESWYQQLLDHKPRKQVEPA